MDISDDTDNMIDSPAVTKKANSITKNLNRLKTVRNTLLESDDDEECNNNNKNKINKSSTTTTTHTNKKLKKTSAQTTNDNEEYADEEDDDDHESVSLVDSSDDDDDDDDSDVASNKKKTNNNKRKRKLTTISNKKNTTVNKTSPVKKITVTTTYTTTNTSTKASTISSSNLFSPKTVTSAFSPISHLPPTTNDSESPSHNTSSNPTLVLPEGVVGPGSHEHNHWLWYKPENRKDGEGRRMSDPEYNHRTLVRVYYYSSMYSVVWYLFIVSTEIRFLLIHYTQSCIYHTTTHILIFTTIYYISYTIYAIFIYTKPYIQLVPEGFMKEQTPAMNQWWRFKRENYDTVLFFKVG